MSFYLSYTNDIYLRETSDVFFFKDGQMLVSSYDEDNKVCDINDNPILVFLNYVKTIPYCVELLLPESIDDSLLDEGLHAISKYLLENDNSIGLLTTDIGFIDKHKDLIDKYNITHSEFKHSFKITYKNEVKLDLSHPKVKRKQYKGPIVFCATLTEPSFDRSGLTLEESFNSRFVKLLNESKKTSVEVYTKGGITRQVFSNILSKEDFIPKKDTIICLIIGMELNYKNAIDLLSCAGYTLSKSIVSDVVVMKYLKQGIYNIDTINSELSERQCPLLGWKPRDN